MTSKNIRIRVKMGNPATEQVLGYSQMVTLIQSEIRAARYVNAASLAQTLARTLPDDVTAHLFAADALLLNREPLKASGYADRAIELSDDPAPAWIITARIAKQLDQPQKALDCLNNLIEAFDNVDEYYYERGEHLLAMGDAHRAAEDFKQALSLNNRHVKSLYRLSLLPEQSIDSATVKKTEFLLKSGQIPSPQQPDAWFALANHYHRVGDAKKHFHNLDAGNRAAAKIHPYQPERHNNDISRTLEFFTEDFFRQAACPTPNPKPLIFILGMPRSGSTLIEQILCAHSRVDSAGENAGMSSAVNEFLRRCPGKPGFPGAFTGEGLGEIPSIAERYLEFIAPLAEGEVIVDKTLGNYFFPGLIHLMFPNARFIHSARHPAATCYSNYSRLFTPGEVAFAYNLDHLASQYQDIAKIMDHWRRVLPAKVHVAQYEELVVDQEESTRELLAFCGLPWEQGCLEFHNNRGTVSTASQLQVKRKLYNSSVDSWRKYSDYLGPVMSL